MKRILGLDLGTGSVGWGLVNEAENDKEKSSIVKLGVRVINYDNFSVIDKKSGKITDSKKPYEDFAAGKGMSPNASRTQKRGARRNLHRFKLRREALIKVLLENDIIKDKHSLTEIGKNTTHETLQLRARAAREKVSLHQLARILLSINKKRGYKSSRKAQNDGDDQAIDGMAVAKEIYDNNLTPGQYALSILQSDKKYIPDFYRSDLKSEFDKVWQCQHQFYPDILTEDLYQKLQGKNKTQTWAICKEPFDIVGIKLDEKGAELKKKKYQLRATALSEKLDLELLAIVLQEINNNSYSSSGYLGAISDRSKKLYFNNQTVGEYLWKQIQNNPHSSLRDQVFYRQDYFDEFEQIWETQKKYHDKLTNELKEQVRDVIIFYQRKLKSQKGLLSYCQFESWEVDKKDNKGNIIINKITKLPKKRTIGKKVIPKSSHLFQEFKIWQSLNHLEFSRKNSEDDSDIYVLSEEDRALLFEELNMRGNLRESSVLKLLNLKSKEWKTNFSNGLEGNRTNQVLYEVYQKIAENEGYGHDWSKKQASEIKSELIAIFPLIGLDPDILEFDALMEGDALVKQKSYQLWHLLYSSEDDHKVSKRDKEIYGNSGVALKKKLHEKYGFKPDYAKMLYSINLQQDHGNLSSKAIRNIIPYLQEGHIFSEACSLAGYNHSNSLTSEENEKRELLDRLELIPKNSLRNPVVEKILNQMVNVVNQIIDEYGKPDEIRIELARHLKKNAKERAEMTANINRATSRNEDIKKLITKEYGIPNPTKNDVVRYRLYLELAERGYKTLYSDQYIHPDKLFTKEIDIEHIIPRAVLFDNSFSNKTLAYSDINRKKSNRTAMDFITEDYSEKVDDYLVRVKNLYNEGKGSISKAKYNKLLMSLDDLPNGFIERDLRESQYIAKKAKNILQDLVRPIIVSTTGSITDRLRKDWDLINVMKELNFPKYKALGLVGYEKRLNQQTQQLIDYEVIQDWTKRNDHRHHAMDALTVAFTTHNHIQYLNNLNARKDENNKKHGNIIAIEKIITHTIDGKRRFVPPIDNFRSEAKKHIDSILISLKNKNKVVTKNINRIKGADEPQETLTPRGQLHKESIYGSALSKMSKPTKINKKLNADQIDMVICQKKKELIINHLNKYNNDPVIAFDSKTMKKDPITWRDEPLKEVYCYETIYTIRKDIAPDLKIDKVVDEGVKNILQKRLEEYGNNAKVAFSDLEENPIWLNKEKGISIKRVTIKGVSNVEAIHIRKDHFGMPILNKEGKEIPSGFVSTGNNHHVAIYKDSEGNLQEQVVSFYEAVARVNNEAPIIDKDYRNEEGWVFLFSMKQNEMFVFPNEDFDVNTIDLLDENNTKLISKHLFRVQKFTNKDYFFRHHLETTVDYSKDLKSISWKREGLSGIMGIKKVRINHIGKIVHIGEY